nr:hypothetical protein [Tanacetum cinerariifolium]
MTDKTKLKEVVKPKPTPPKSKPTHVKPKSKEVVKPKPTPLKSKVSAMKPKPAVKPIIGKRKRLVDEVVSDVLDDLNAASEEGEDDEGDLNENVVGDGDSDEEDQEYEAKESEEEDGKGETFKEEEKHVKKGNNAKKKKKETVDRRKDKEGKVFEIVVTVFTRSTYEFKLEKGIIRVTPKKVYEILGVPLGETSIFDLPERSLDDDFVKMRFKQFDPNPLKDIRATDIAEKLVLANTADFMFRVNFLTLFANVMGTTDTMKAIVNLISLRCIREDTNVVGVDWCGFIHSYLQHNAIRNTTHGFYIGSFTILIETVLLEKDQVHVDDFHPGDGEKVETDVGGEKQTMVEAENVIEDVVNEA